MPANTEVNRTGPANKRFHVRPDESRSDEKKTKPVVARDASRPAAAVKGQEVAKSRRSRRFLTSEASQHVQFSCRFDLRGRVIPQLKSLETAPFAIVVLFYWGWSEARSIEDPQERIRVENRGRGWWLERCEGSGRACICLILRMREWLLLLL